MRRSWSPIPQQRPESWVLPGPWPRKWEDTGLEKPEWAVGDEVWFNPKEDDVLNYLKGWEDKMNDPHPREPYNG